MRTQFIFWAVVLFSTLNALAEHGEPEKKVQPPRELSAIGDCSVTDSTYTNPKNKEEFCTITTTNGGGGSCCGVVSYNACESYPKFARWKKTDRTEEYDNQCFRKSR